MCGYEFYGYFAEKVLSFNTPLERRFVDIHNIGLSKHLYKKYVEKYNYKTVVIDFSNIPLEEIYKRNANREILKQVSKDLQQTSQTYQLDAELLISYVLKKSREYIYLNPDKIVLKTELQQLNKIVKQRKEGKPIAYIIKEKPFFNHNFFVDNRVLIPRPET